MNVLNITVITIITIAVFNLLGAGTLANIVSFIVFVGSMIYVDRSDSDTK